ncbi:hypothetical protein PAXINDRAFT_18317 [Paxillus involutus ATCC 200175]|uniref:DUF6532 domain-containing protein n=1 Tax=Paxillus involutus ATCC 200175 TaxID=664439 RepID=A0A0C9TLD1_PAXIN|nr:hypothetical protein PAXINDRAFT_18317 [Paxillus involutus ATCC 200175]
MSAHDQDEQGSQAGTEKTEDSQAATLIDQDESHVLSRQGSKHSKTSKANTVPCPNTLACFIPLWCKLLDDGKVKLRLHLTTEDPFPLCEMAIDSICMEIIIELTVKYQVEGLELESEQIQFVKNKVAELLENARFLRGAPDSLGKTSNFVHHALKKACIAYFYSSSDKVLHQFPDFQQYVPERVLLLITAMVHFVLEVFATRWFGKRVTLNAEQVERYYNDLCGLLNQVSADEYHR